MELLLSLHALSIGSINQIIIGLSVFSIYLILKANFQWKVADYKYEMVPRWRVNQFYSNLSKCVIHCAFCFDPSFCVWLLWQSDCPSLSQHLRVFRGVFQMLMTVQCCVVRLIMSLTDEDLSARVIAVYHVVATKVCNEGWNHESPIICFSAWHWLIVCLSEAVIGQFIISLCVHSDEHIVFLSLSCRVTKGSVGALLSGHCFTVETKYNPHFCFCRFTFSILIMVKSREDLRT